MQQLVLRRGEADVQPVDQYPIYELGGALAHLKEVASASSSYATSPPPPNINAIYWADHFLERLLNGVPLAISFSRGAAESLRRVIDRLLEDIQRAATEPPSENAMRGVVTAADRVRYTWSQLARDIEVFEHQFSAELKKTSTYAVPERGIFNTESLVDAADRHIHESVRDDVSEFAIKEFQASGRCLAFGLCSASGFHSARAVESVLRGYHKFFLPKQNSEALTMGQMASALNDMYQAKKKPLVLPKPNTVRHIKDFTEYDRNPLMHKTVVLEEIHAVTLFNSAASLIVEMTKELADQESSAKGPLLEGLELSEPPTPTSPNGETSSSEEQPA